MFAYPQVIFFFVSHVNFCSFFNNCSKSMTTLNRCLEIHRSHLSFFSFLALASWLASLTKQLVDGHRVCIIVYAEPE